MTTQIKLRNGPRLLAEMQEFGSFDTETQLYIRRSLDVAFSAEPELDRWLYSESEVERMRAQRQIYRALPDLRRSIPVDGEWAAADAFLCPLIGVSAFDLTGDDLTTFSGYRFLYERLLGADIRPWLPGAFAAAAALPHLLPHRRQALFASLGSGVTDRWSPAEPAFYPEWLPA